VFDQILFILSAVLTMGGALAVVFSRNLMHACVFLLACLFGVAGLYATLNADFLAATQLVVYAGGVVILMLFAVMLTGGVQSTVNKFGLEKIPGMGNTKTYTAAGLSVIIISFVLFKILKNAVAIAPKGQMVYESTVEKIGTLLVSDHVLAFELSSILLLGALVGAAVIARPRHIKDDV
tara:strand:+ start:28472 stop:29008 length:537 start_codon:yes stop_codon:yes gene_type:complete